MPRPKSRAAAGGLAAGGRRRRQRIGIEHGEDAGLHLLAGLAVIALGEQPGRRDRSGGVGHERHGAHALDRRVLGLGLLEEGLQPVEVGLEQRVVFMVVAVAAAHRHAEHGRARGGDDFGEHFRPVPLGLLEDGRRGVVGAEPQESGGG
jgi:hypothetical protein